ncbi:fibroblast growth factor receptor substrate 3 [Alosa alosa]|uniref:fibroblast growth factor receptor substrate 3 n=1 Tax=Alosa alosa TaxID=278164 RepID=UPI0020155052|nr:fibroblast growth factor receptor substrate 3 [Alosa alosa]
MGSCWSCLYRDSIQDNHPNKFKVTNVDDEGNELGSGTMELTQTELILHTRKRDAIRWPYLCLRRYGYDSNLFSFESGRRCQTGQGIFAFKCSRAEEIFNLLQELMQCNSINVVEEPMLMTRPAHTPEIDMSRTPQTPNTPAFPVQGFPNGYPGYSISGDSSQPSLNDDHGHSLMGLDDQEEQDEDEEEEEEEEEYEEEEEEDEEDFDEYEFSEGPGTPNGYHQQEAGVHRDALQNYVNTDQMQIPAPPRHACPPHLPPHPQRPCQAERGGRIFGFPHLRRRSGGGGSARGGRGSCEHGHMPPPPSRQLNYIQVDLDGESPSVCQGHGAGAAGVGPVSQRSLAHKRGMAASASGPPPPRRSEFYAVIDLKKTVAMSNLQKALPRDDGTSRKTRHNSTDLPL